VKSEWYKIWFSSKYYLELYKHRDVFEAQNVINLIQRTLNIGNKSRIIDVCCGAGRHSLELAKRGYDVTGIDLSEFLISQAKLNYRKSPEKNLKAKFLIKDMRNFNFEKSFDVALNIFTSFGYFQDDGENFKMFTNVHKSLKDNGYFIFDYLNDTYLKDNLIPESNDKINGLEIVQKRRIENKFVIKDIYIGKQKFTEILKLYSRIEISSFLIYQGFDIIEFFGDYYGNPFDKDNSKRLIIFAEKY
jgi:SAM-dependent methyltransferase